MTEEDNILIRLKYNYVRNIKHYVNARTAIVEVESKYYRTAIFTNDNKSILDEIQKMSGQKVKICFIEYEDGFQIVKKRHSTRHDVWTESKYGWCLSNSPDDLLIYYDAMSDFFELDFKW